jgi:hypothetical protein
MNSKIQSLVFWYNSIKDSTGNFATPPHLFTDEELTEITFAPDYFMEGFPLLFQIVEKSRHADLRLKYAYIQDLRERQRRAWTDKIQSDQKKIEQWEQQYTTITKKPV